MMALIIGSKTVFIKTSLESRGKYSGDWAVYQDQQPINPLPGRGSVISTGDRGCLGRER